MCLLISVYFTYVQYYFCSNLILTIRITFGVADPHHFDADPDPDPAGHFMWIQILPKGSKPWKNAQIGSYTIPFCHLHTDVDPDPDPASALSGDANPTFQFYADPCGFGSATLLFGYMYNQFSGSWAWSRSVSFRASQIRICTDPDPSINKKKIKKTLNFAV
jgi:hypothetical protein